MNELVQDTWEDLRERRLWPIALLLVLALIAIPFLLTRSAETPLPGEPAAVAPPAAVDERTAVTLDDGGAAASGTGSSLEKFAESDPFTPPAAIARAGKGATAQATLASTSDGASGGGGGGGGSDASPPSTDGGEPAPVVPPQTRTETAEYEYVADVTFWNGDRRRTVKGLRKLDMLPNQSAPVLIFMGTAGNGGNAVFLVDSTLKARGEGRCVPSPANCAYVHIGPGAEHLFTTEEGDAYRLRVEEIRRVKVNPSASSSATAVAGTTASATRRFQLPSLIDLVAVTETTTTVPSQPSDGGSAQQSDTDRSSNPGRGR
jgi:hypothetical protein